MKNRMIHHIKFQRIGMLFFIGILLISGMSLIVMNCSTGNVKPRQLDPAQAEIARAEELKAYARGKEKEIIFAAADLFCMPSISESFGLVYLEAWHKKKPVIAANIPAVKELIGDGGMLVEYGNQKQLSKLIVEILESQDLSLRLGSNGYNRLIRNYDFDKLLSKYRALFYL